MVKIYLGYKKIIYVIFDYYVDCGVLVYVISFFWWMLWDFREIFWDDVLRFCELNLFFLELMIDCCGCWCMFSWVVWRWDFLLENWGWLIFLFLLSVLVEDFFIIFESVWEFEFCFWKDVKNEFLEFVLVFGFKLIWFLLDVEEFIEIDLENFWCLLKDCCCFENFCCLENFCCFENFCCCFVLFCCVLNDGLIIFCFRNFEEDFWFIKCWVRIELFMFDNGWLILKLMNLFIGLNLGMFILNDCLLFLISFWFGIWLRVVFNKLYSINIEKVIFIIG